MKKVQSIIREQRNNGTKSTKVKNGTWDLSNAA